MKFLKLKRALFTFLLSISFSGLFAQMQVFIEYLQPPCTGECVEVYVTVTGGQAPYVYNWNNGMTSTDEYFLICDEIPGTFTYCVVVTDATGISATGCIDIFWQPYQQYFLYSNAQDVCPANDSIAGGPNTNICQKVCANSTVTYWAENTWGGTTGLATWTVLGADSYIVNDSAGTVTVNWGTPGTGSVSAFFWDQYCGGQATSCVDILDDPTAAIGSNPAAESGVITVCEGQTIYFENLSTGASTYEWNFGIGSSEETNPEFTYQSPGSYTVQLIAYNECLCSDTTSVLVQVINAENPNVDCVATVCEGETITYTSDASCGTYFWNVSSNGNVINGGGPGDNFITIDWVSGPIGTIELQVDDCGGANFCLAPTFVEVPIITDNAPIQGKVNVCKGAVEVYSLPAYEATEYIWAVTNFGTIIAGQGTHEITVEWNNQFYPSAAQTISVSYENCYLECGGEATLTVEVEPEYYLTGTIEVCENDSETYAAINTQNNMSFGCNWTISQNGTVVQTINAATDPVIDWNFGTGYFKLTAVPVVPDDYCTDVFEMNVNVVPTPPQVNAINGETNICPGTPYSYEADSGTPENNFRWQVNNGGTITERYGNPITVTWGNAGPYELSVVQINSTGIPCESEALDLSVQAIAGFTITGTSDVCRDQISVFTTEYYAGIDYGWSINPASAGTIIGDPSLSTIEIIWFEDGAAVVELSACSVSTSMNVNVYPLPQPVVTHPAELCPAGLAMVQTTQAFDSYEWKDEFGTLVSTLATPDIGPGYYRVSVTNQYGCVGDTTFYIDAKPASVINISTPDPTVFCGVPPDATLYAINSSAGYSYQWYLNGSPVGTDDPVYQAIAYGNYSVEITDSYGCTAGSNVIEIGDCGSGGGIGGGPDCVFSGGNFDLLGGITCNERAYQQASGVTPVAGSETWNFSDPESGASNYATGPNPTHAFSQAGFFKVIMWADYINATGDLISCPALRVDTSLMAADFEVDNACPGEVIEFFDLSTFLPFVNIVSWQWDFGDPASGANNTSTDQNPTHIFASEGSYNVTLTAMADNGCLSTITRVLNVYPAPPVNFEEPAIGCAATASGFIAEVSNTVTYVQWDFGDPASGNKNTSEIFDAYHLYDNPGVYTVTLFVQSIYGCSNTFSRDITIEPNTLIGEIALSGSLPLCEGDSITLTAPAGGVSWVWSTDEITESITVGEEGVYEVTLTDVNGCSYTPAVVVVEVVPAPDAPIRAVEYNDYGQPTAFFNDGYSTCEGEDVFLEVIEGANYSYQWSTGDFGSETEYSEDRGNLLPAGNYDIFVTVTDNTTSCTNIMGPFEVVIHPVPQNVTITASVAGLICEDTETTFSVVNPDLSLTYVWNTGEVGTSITTGEAGDYSVRAITEFGCESESNTLTIVEGPDVSKIPSGCHTRCSPDTICIPPIAGITSYQWYFNGSAIPAPDGNISDLIIDESGEYYVEMVSTLGCVLASDPLTVDLYDGFGTLQGEIYSDVNLNGIIDAGDTLVSGVNINLILAGAQIGSDGSDANGFYAFENILSTAYTLEIDTQSIPAGLQATVLSVDTMMVGCDVILEINWLLEEYCEESPFVEVQFTECAGGLVDYNGTIFTNDTTFTVVYAISATCDSTEAVSIQFMDEIVENVELYACSGTTVSYEGQTYDPGDQDVVQLMSVTGCDSTINLTVSEIFPTTTNMMLEACPGESRTFAGMELQIGEQMDFVYTNAAGCDSTVTVAVVSLPETEVDAQVDESCPNISTGVVNVAVDNGVGPFEYSLDGATFQASPAFAGLQADDYTAYVRDNNGCVATLDFSVDAMDYLVVQVDDELLPCETLETELKLNILSGDDGNLTFLWNNGATDPNLLVHETGTYSVQVANSCEVVSANAAVQREVEPSATGIYVPNAFSPNNDGPNDLFMVYPGPEIQFQDYNFAVFDRWGNNIFQSENQNDGWNGKTQNAAMKPGVYIWQLKATVNICGKMEKIRQSGEVVLLR
ncbi:MAG: PKD domain-containing protein [Saprospiraceae bacterium]|nr:PKD domain-containing protein [Saprospiraceae bacterium]